MGAQGGRRRLADPVLERRADGNVVVTAAYINLGEADRAALTQFTQDMTYLKRQIEGAAGG